MSIVAALAAVAATCTLPAGWTAVEARRPTFVVFGELHGTEQAPALVAQIACALAERRERLLVAIEQGSPDDPALQRAWAEPDGRFAAALRTYPGWKGRDDGVGSRAMFDLLVALHRLSATGHTVDVVAFNGERDEAQRRRFARLRGQGPHEAAQAENIRIAARRQRYDRVLVLTGAFHAGKRRFGRGATAFDPMARRLAPAGETMSLRLVNGSGTAWDCSAKPGRSPGPGKSIRPDAIECGNHPIREQIDLGPAPTIYAGDPPTDDPPGTYDGYVWMGRVTGSAPVDDGVRP